MKEDVYTDIICKKFCRFYKGDKEELQCGTYRYLVEQVPLDQIRKSSENLSDSPDFSQDEAVYEQICKKCEFLVDGCDFRNGLDSPPCGGYVIVEYLMKRKVK